MVALMGAGVGFRENLKRAREAKGWTQAQTATEARVPLRTYQNWEAGSREPRLDALARLAAAFGVSADELLEGVAEEAAAEDQADAEPRRKKK